MWGRQAVGSIYIIVLENILRKSFFAVSDRSESTPKEEVR